ncbi:MAG: tetratricopeptide repeat protein [Alicyclobacillus sp.]|nr:tetratricopeptide repeat protein [Alicyclobacillus sp.]
MRLDAAFFFERGVRSLERNDLQGALKAFRKTVEYEPDNPVNHCNLAGVLSELGDFAASNEVLMHVLRDLDPSMVECQFYMANNFANMGDYETAEEYVLRYLDAAPNGEYAEDAEEMLGILLGEFGGGKALARWEAERRQRERWHAEQDGRHLLEEGQFEAAVEWLERVVQNEPENTAALNNLSLAYYYTGRYEEAVAAAERVLAWQPDNLHALCNLAVFSAYLGQRERLHTLIRTLSKLFPLHYDHAMKLGTTLGLVGEHRAALQLFMKLVRLQAEPEPLLLHALAAAAANLGAYATARRAWRTLLRRGQLDEVANYYLVRLEQAERAGARRLRVSYQSDLPVEAQFAKLKERLERGDFDDWRQDPLLRASLYWGLRHGAEDTCRAVVRTLAWLADADAEKALRAFLQRPELSPSLQAAALYVLQRMGARGRVSLWRDGERVTLRMSEVPRDIILAVDPAWQLVWQAAEAWLREQHKTRLRTAAKAAWTGYLKHAFLRKDVVIGKPEVWAAALVYATLKRHNETVRQKDVAESFHVSSSSLSRAASQLTGFFMKMP